MAHRQLMKQTLAAMIRNGLGKETELDQPRRELAPPQQEALDALLADLHGATVGAALASHFSPMERVLLLIAIHQQRQIDCLNFFLQRQSQQILDSYLKVKD